MKDSSYMHPILLVEDNPLDVDLTIRAFNMRNVSNPIEVARDGEEAINKIDEWDSSSPLPIVVLLDLKLPKFNGIKVLEHIRNSERFKTVPVVVLTTSSDDFDVKTSYELGANSYIVKPVDFEKFVEVAAQIELYWNIINRPYFSNP